MKSHKYIKNIATAFFSFALVSFAFTFLNKKLSLIKTDLEKITNNEIKEEKVKALFYNSISSKSFEKSPATPNKKAKLYTLELGLSSDIAVAQRKIDEYNKRNIPAFFTPLRQGSKTYYRIRLGLFSSKKEALATQKKLSTKNINAKVRSL